LRAWLRLAADKKPRARQHAPTRSPAAAVTFGCFTDDDANRALPVYMGFDSGLKPNPIYNDAYVVYLR
jgi:hypothetical protein